MLRSCFASFMLLTALVWAAPGWAMCADLRAGPVGIVTQVTDGDTVVLDNGLIVRLIGTQAPKLPLGREGFDAWPQAGQSKQALERLVLNKSVKLGYGGAERDRYDRVLAHVFVDGPEEIWAQEAMLAQGMARVYSFADNRKCLGALFAAEGQARADHLGIWGDDYYKIRAASRPTELLGRIGHYELVEGRVLLADMVGKRVYLNFGRIWKEDFTAVIDAPALKLFTQSGRDPSALDGALLRIRGWVDERDGPRIEITHPEQIEVLATR